MYRIMWICSSPTSRNNIGCGAIVLPSYSLQLPVRILLAYKRFLSRTHCQWHCALARNDIIFGWAYCAEKSKGRMRRTKSFFKLSKLAAEPHAASKRFDNYRILSTEASFSKLIRYGRWLTEPSLRINMCSIFQSPVLFTLSMKDSSRTLSQQARNDKYQ